MKKIVIALLSLALPGFLGCSGAREAAREADGIAQVRAAVERYLSERTDLSLASMRLVVDNVTFEGDRANATVTIVARNDPEAKMAMLYRLRKTADGWEVEPPQGSEAGAHGGGAPRPQAGGESELPPGHPPVGGDRNSEVPELPPGHPPVQN